MGMKFLREAVEKAKRDTFEEGTVIRWIGGGRYTYAAIKTPIGWVSTSRYDNGFVPKTMDFETLLEVLGRADNTDVEVSTGWVSPADVVPGEVVDTPRVVEEGGTGEFQTLGDIARELHKMRGDGMTREAVQYAMDRVYWEEAEEPSVGAGRV